MGGTGRALLNLSHYSPPPITRFPLSLLSTPKRFYFHKFAFFPPPPKRGFLGFRPLCSATATSTSTTIITKEEDAFQPLKHSILLERLRLRHLKGSSNDAGTEFKKSKIESLGDKSDGVKKKSKKNEVLASSFEELGLTEEAMGALSEMNISAPTEIQCIGIHAVLAGKSVVLGSHTGSGKTLAYMLPLVQLLRRDEMLNGILMKPRRPRAVVLCPTRELCEQVFRVSKSISHHARFRSTMVSGGGRLRPQEDSLNTPIDMVVGTPGRVLQHIEDGNLVYGDIKYLVLDEADTMFDRGFGPDIRKFLSPLKNRALNADDAGFQTVLVTATMTTAVQKLVDEEFKGIVHLRTSTLHKKIANARHDFIKLSGSENKLEALLQVLEPSLSRGNRVMVFCNTLNSSRAVDHFLNENQMSTVNYHGEVPAQERVKNLEKFKSDEGDCPTLVCTDLAARGLDLDVDHVVMFDFPLNAIDYLHRTGRTARMGAKGKVTSLVAKKDVLLASRIEEAIAKNESLESLSLDSVRRDKARSLLTDENGKNNQLLKVSKRKDKSKPVNAKSTDDLKSKSKPSQDKTANKTTKSFSKSPKVTFKLNSLKERPGSGKKPRDAKKSGDSSRSPKVSFKSKNSNTKERPGSGKKQLESKKSGDSSRSPKVSFKSKNSNTKPAVKKQLESKKSGDSSPPSKLNVVGFRGRSSVSLAQKV